MGICLAGQKLNPRPCSESVVVDSFEFLALNTCSAPNDDAKASRLSDILGDRDLAERLIRSGRASSSALSALVALADQSVRMGIDYQTLGLGWDHPETRMQYRLGQHPSTLAAASRSRSEASRAALLTAIAAAQEGKTSFEAVVRSAFLYEIGAAALVAGHEPPSGNDATDAAGKVAVAASSCATFAGVAAALQAELLLPLRALCEGQQYMHRTYQGEPIPPAEISNVVADIVAAVVSCPEGFTEWRYSNPTGVEQLRGLSRRQMDLWRSPTRMQHCIHEQRLRTSEVGHAGELDYFWATKIGGPSHGFDYEAQCLLPLLANARHKVVLLSDPAWPHYAAGRAHWRLLWTAGSGSQGQTDDRDLELPPPPPPLASTWPPSRTPSQDDGTDFPPPPPPPPPLARGLVARATASRSGMESEPRLWLEGLHCDFDANHVVDRRCWMQALLLHAISKADAMCVPLSVEPPLAGELWSLAQQRNGSPFKAFQVVNDRCAKDRGDVGRVVETSERILLRPSNGVIEASDYLSSRHDWVLLTPEITEPLPRVLYLPPGWP